MLGIRVTYFYVAYSIGSTKTFIKCRVRDMIYAPD